jgi:predicted lipoprotein
VPVEIDLDEIAEGQGIEIVLQISPAMRDTKLRRVSG